MAKMTSAYANKFNVVDPRLSCYFLWIIVDGSLIRSECKRIQILVCRKLGVFALGVWKFGYTCSVF